MTDIIVKDIKNGSEYYYWGWVDVEAEDVSYDNTTSGMTADNVQDALDEVVGEVSNGKELIADAITDKWVSTSASDSFATMADNIAMLPSRSVITDSLFKLTTDNYSHTSDKSRKSLETVFFNWDYSFNDEAYVAIRVYLDNAWSGSSDRYADEEIFYKKPWVAWETYMAWSSNYWRKGDFCLLKKWEEFKTLFYYGTTPNASTTSKTTVFEYTINKNEITRQLIYDSSSWESATIWETEYNNELNTLLSDWWEDVSSMPGLWRATYSQTSWSGSNYYTQITVSH